MRLQQQQMVVVMRWLPGVEVVEAVGRCLPVVPECAD